MSRATKTVLIVYLGSLICLSSAVLAQNQLAEEISVPEPTQLHTAAQAPGAVLVRSELLGEIDSSDSTALIVVIDVEGADGAQTRGVKMSLSNSISSDQVYIPERLLPNFQDELREIELWRHRIGKCQAKVRCVQGIARCRPSRTEEQAYCPGRFSTPTSQGGFVLSTPRNTFFFPSVEATEFDALLENVYRALE